MPGQMATTQPAPMPGAPTPERKQDVMTTETLTPRPVIRDTLAALMPVGATVTTLHIGTTRPRTGTSRSDVAVLVTAPAVELPDVAHVVNVSALVARLTTSAKATTRHGVSAVRVLGHPGNPGMALVADLAIALHGSSTALHHAAL